MRDSKRLNTFYNNLKMYHSSVPDWRFGQLIVNFQRWYGKDIFYLEEDEFINLLYKFMKEMQVF